MSLDGLEEPEDDPDVDGDDVKRDLRPDGLRKDGEEQRTSDGSSSEDEDFHWVSVLGGLVDRKRWRGWSVRRK